MSSLIRFFILIVFLKPPRIQALTGLRAIAAIMVFLYHNRKYWREDIPDFLLLFLNECQAGVSIFFVLSGFLIAYTYKNKPLDSKKEYLKYLLVRLIRIFPVYLVILTLMYCDNGFANTKETLLTYTLLHGLSDKFNLSGIPQSWSLTVELCFYTLAPFIYGWVKKNLPTTILYLLLILLLAFFAGYGWYWLNGNPDRFLYPWFFILNASFPGRIVEFLAGVLLAHYLLTNATTIPTGFRHKTVAGGIALIVIMYGISLLEPTIYTHGTDTIAGLLIRNLLFPFAVAFILYGLISERTWIQRFLSTKMLVLMGNASFIFYLVHIGYVNTELRNWYLFPDRNFILLWLVSIAGYLLIERPVYETLKKRIRRWQ
jgi:peptidoglycan/LPS O-acetylase OafA/YrhL